MTTPKGINHNPPASALDLDPDRGFRNHFPRHGQTCQDDPRETVSSHGRMIDIGGYRLHIHVEGDGNPTVVFDAGAGGIGLAWELVCPAIAEVTRVVTYDRAGLGWSDPSPKPRRADVMAEELYTRLRNAKVEGKYILVGQSLGGVVMRQFAAKYPNEVAGLVMVDSAHEQPSNIPLNHG